MITTNKDDSVKLWHAVLGEATSDSQKCSWNLFSS